MAATNGGCCALTVAISNNLERIINRSRYPSNAACCLHGAHPCALIGPDAAGGCLDLDAGEDGDALADVLRADGDGAPADKVSGALGQAEGDEPAGAWVRQGSDLIAKGAHVRQRAQRQAYLLLKGCLGVGHAPAAHDAPTLRGYSCRGPVQAR